MLFIASSPTKVPFMSDVYNFVLGQDKFDFSVQKSHKSLSLRLILVCEEGRTREYLNFV